MWFDSMNLVYNVLLVIEVFNICLFIPSYTQVKDIILQNNNFNKCCNETIFAEISNVVMQSATIIRLLLVINDHGFGPIYLLLWYIAACG